MEIRFTFDDELSAGIDRALAAHQDFTPAMAAIARVLASGVEGRFDAETDPDGVPWLPSARAVEDGGKTLQVKGIRGGLLGSLLNNAGYDASSAWIGTSLPYAGIHQDGGTIRPREGGGKRALRTPFGPRASVNMPRRAFLGFGEMEQQEIPEILADFLRDAWAGGAA